MATAHTETSAFEPIEREVIAAANEALLGQRVRVVSLQRKAHGGMLMSLRLCQDNVEHLFSNLSAEHTSTLEERAYALVVRAIQEKFALLTATMARSPLDAELEVLVDFPGSRELYSRARVRSSSHLAMRLLKGTVASSLLFAIVLFAWDVRSHAMNPAHFDKDQL